MIFPDKGGPDRDVVTLLTFINDYFLDFGEEIVDVDTSAINRLVHEMHAEFPYPGGPGYASPFKQVATFVCYFVARRPIGTSLPDDVLGDLPSGQTPVARTNAVVALEIAIESLRFATVRWEDGQTFLLSNPLVLSDHSFVDIADALTILTPADHFKLVSVLFEQIAYKSNERCQYPAE